VSGAISRGLAPLSLSGKGARGLDTDDNLLSQLKAIAPVRRDEPLARHVTFGIGGPADLFVTVRTADELARTVVAVRNAGAPLFILGSGSNILVGDGGIRGVVIDNQAKRIEGPVASDRGEHADRAWLVSAESGVAFATLARHLAKDGYGGIEWASGIPGSLGGAAVYNAGAYGGCLADVLHSVTMLLADGAQREMPAADLKLTYRSSIFTRGECTGCVVLALSFAVTPGDPAALLRRIEEIDEQRLGAQPRGRNGGSTFKNPDGHHAWELIDAVGLRGYRIGGAQISEQHCNFFLNTGAARAANVFALMQEARRRVEERFGIELEAEIELVGEGFA
jgi:UDP-N-acetylmuramate dehydrogenase